MLKLRHSLPLLSVRERPTLNVEVLARWHAWQAFPRFVLSGMRRDASVFGFWIRKALPD